MAEDPLIIPIKFDTTGAQRDLDQLEERAKRGVTVPARGEGQAATRRGGTPSPPTAHPSPAAATFQEEINAAWSRGDTATARRLTVQAQSLQLPVAAPRDADAGYRQRSARVERSWDTASFAQFKQQERNEERFQRNLDSANLALQRSREREAAAAARNAEKEEARATAQGSALAERTTRAQMGLDASQAKTPQERAGVYRRYAQQYEEGSPEKLQLLTRANVAEQTPMRRPGGFGGRFGALSMGLFIAGLELQRALEPIARYQQARVAAEGASMEEQFAQQQALVSADSSDPLRYYTQKGLSRVPGLNRVYSDPDEAQRALTEAKRQFQAQQQAALLREETLRTREATSAVGVPEFQAARQGIENTFAQAQRQAAKMRNEAKNVTGSDATTVQNAANELETAARSAADRQIQELTRQTVGAIRQRNLTTKSRNDILQGYLLRGAMAGVDAEFDPQRSSGTVTGFGGRNFRTVGGNRLPGITDQDYADFESRLNEYTSRIDTAKIADAQRRILQRSAVQSGAFALNRQQTLSQLQDIAGERQAAMFGVDNPERIREINDLTRTRVLQTLQASADQTQLIDIGQSGRAAQLTALLNRDPTSANVVGIVSQARAEEAQLRQAGLIPQADRARQLGIQSLNLQRQNYLDQFTNVEVSRTFPFSLQAKDAEDPLTVLRNIQNGIQDLGASGTVAGPNDLPALFRELLNKIDSLKELVTS